MKKFVAIIVSLMCILALLPVGTYAADNPADLTDEIFENVFSWHRIAGDFHPTALQFDEGSSLVSHVLVSFIKLDVATWQNTRYLGDNGNYYVPVAKCHEVLCDYIYVSDEALAGIAEYLPVKTVNGIQCYEIAPYIDERYFTISDEYYGYKANKNGTYTAYLYRFDEGKWLISDTTGLVENVDYVYGIGTNMGFSEFMYYERVLGNFGISSVYEAVLSRNADGELVIVSYKKVDALPAANDTSVIRPDYTNDTAYTQIIDNSGYVSVDWKGHFPDGSTVTVNQQKNKPNAWLNLVEKTSIHTDANKYLVFSIDAMDKLGNPIQPTNAPITITFDIPEDFGDNVELFYVDTAGAVSEIAGSVSKDGSEFIASLDHFSVYVLADMKDVVPEVPEQTEPTPEETTEPTPEETEPAPEETTAPPVDTTEPVPEETTPVTPPETTEPEVTEPEITEPEVTEPEITEPEATEAPADTEVPADTEAPTDTTPEATEPETTEPEVVEPEETTGAPVEPEVPEQTEAPSETDAPATEAPEDTQPEETTPDNPTTGDTATIVIAGMILMVIAACVITMYAVKKRVD